MAADDSFRGGGKDCVGGDEMIDYHKILNTFCSQVTESRFAIQAPFYSDGYAVGTDGRAMCCVPENLVELTQPAGNVPKVSMILPTGEATELWFDPKSLHDPALSESLDAWRKSRLPINKDCRDCEGTGVCVCDCGDEHDCRECEGTGEVEAFHRIESPEAWFQGKLVRYDYLDRISRAAEFAGKNAIRCSLHGNLFHFVADELQFVVMAMISDKVENTKAVLIPQVISR